MNLKLNMTLLGQYYIRLWLLFDEIFLVAKRLPFQQIFRLPERSQLPNLLEQLL